jgi:N-acetylglutamate synthase-like GNAT family acetyltransferase
VEASRIEIVRHAPSLEQGVVDFILGVQRDEFGLDTSALGQPDLLDVAGYYQSGAGNFWVALDGGEVVGTIALRDIGHGQGALRKMYVKATHRGKEHAVGARLLEQLLQSAAAAGLQQIHLATAEVFVAAHRFYEKNGFVRVDADALPEAFPRIPQETRFYRRALA